MTSSDRDLKTNYSTVHNNIITNDYNSQVQSIINRS